MALTQKKKAKGLPKRTGKAATKMSIQRHFQRAMDKKYRRVLANEGKAAADQWKLDRIHKAIAK